MKKGLLYRRISIASTLKNIQPNEIDDNLIRSWVQRSIVQDSVNFPGMALELDYSVLGAFLKAFRRCNGISQAEVCNKIGVTPSYLAHIERGSKTNHINLMRFFVKTIRMIIADKYGIEDGNIKR